MAPAQSRCGAMVFLSSKKLYLLWEARVELVQRKLKFCNWFSNYRFF